MARRWPALDIRLLSSSGQIIDPDLLLAELDDFSPTAIEVDGPCVRSFFQTAAARDAAAASLSSRYSAQAVDVSDEDWAERSQADLESVTVGRLTILPFDRRSPITRSPDRRSPDPPSATSLYVPPSMAFGTGHHATTRLCLAALQALDLSGRSVIDVGTGSGILALAARLLGAAEATGVDNDADAVAAARDNLARNPHVGGVEFVERDLRAIEARSADVVVANLTGTLIRESAATLKRMVRRGGHLVTSGLLAEEAPAVVTALAPMKKVWQAEEDGWIGLILVQE